MWPGLGRSAANTNNIEHMAYTIFDTFCASNTMIERAAMVVVLVWMPRPPAATPYLKRCRVLQATVQLLRPPGSVRCSLLEPPHAASARAAAVLELLLQLLHPLTCSLLSGGGCLKLPRKLGMLELGSRQQHMMAGL